MKLMTMLLAGTLILAAENLSASEQEQEDQQKTAVIVVVGAAGAPEYGEQFAGWANLWKQACSKGGATCTIIGLDEAEAPGGDRTRLRETLDNETGQYSTALWLVLIGHGTFDGHTAKFNLRGTDVSSYDLARWLEPLHRPVAIIDTTSSSAPFLSSLSAPGRVVITATKSGFEQNYARFGQYLAGSIAEPQADLDKDGQTSLLEAFLIASRRVDEFYSSAGRLTTEHALLDDNGDGLGTRADWFKGIRPVQKAEDDAPLDGYRAHQFHLVPSELEKQMTPALRAERDRLELEVMKLRDRKEEFPEDEYFSKLETLLFDITKIYDQADKAGDKPQ